MVYLCVDKSGEYIANNKPTRNFFEWEGWENTDGESCTLIRIPSGTIEKLIGRKLTWEDDPVDLDEFMYHNGEL